MKLAANAEQGCDSWPDDLKPLRDCCNTPRHYNSALLSHCFTKCNGVKVTENDQKECAIDCYSNVTLLLTKERKINKNIVKRIYANNALHDVVWMKVINQSVDGCDSLDSGASSQSLAKFYECVNENLENNCVKFFNTDACDKVQEYFERCNNIKADCEHWPDSLAYSDGCCKTPQIFSQNYVLACRKKCASIEFFPSLQVKCVESCLINDTSLKVEGSFNFTVVKKLLHENTNDRTEWEKLIEETVGKCEVKMQGALL